eukprot:2802495-Rhodomonas_salina.1
MELALQRELFPPLELLNESYGASSSFYCEQPARLDMNTAQKLSFLVPADSTNNHCYSIAAKLQA